MSFRISLSDEVIEEFDELVLRGEIEINGYRESFFAPVDFWSKLDYVNSWKKSLIQGLQTCGHAVLLTSMRDPKFCNFAFYWVVYIEGEDAYIQNGVFFMERLPSPFVMDEINSYISERQEIDEDGFSISQWKVNKKSVVDFLSKL